MREEKLELTPTCHFVKTHYGQKFQDITLEYTEHSPDPWYSDTDTCIDIDKEIAIKIIDFLKQAFNIK